MAPVQNAILPSPEEYPPLAPIPAVRSRKESAKLSRSNSSMPKDCPFVPPNLPSRCTWKPNADRKDCPHSKEEV